MLTLILIFTSDEDVLLLDRYRTGNPKDIPVPALVQRPWTPWDFMFCDATRGLLERGPAPPPRDFTGEFNWDMYYYSSAAPLQTQHPK